MKIRTAEHDASATGAAVSSRLSAKASPVGGTFGFVRSSGAKPHQGWDLYASVGTPVYAVAPGVIQYSETHGNYGTQICLRLDEQAMTHGTSNRFGRQLFAFYAHLSLSFVKAGQAVLEGEVIGLSGNSGNAASTPPHLHFELRTQPRLSTGLGGRLDPGELLGFVHYRSI
jgi:murein DD-endopeptidase MepM/ murein hydrolase activator NlpD